MIICKPVIKIRCGIHGLRGFFDEIDVIAQPLIRVIRVIRA